VIISPLPDLAGPSSLPAPAGVTPQAPVLPGAALDFAGLLMAAQPESGAAGESALLTASTPSYLPTGKNVPEPSASLPPLSLPTSPLASRDMAVRPPLPIQDSAEAPAVSEAAGVEPEIETPVFAGITLPKADAALPDPSKPEPASVAASEPALLAGSTPPDLSTGKNVPEPGASLPPLPLTTPPLAIRDVAVRTPSPSQDSDEALPLSEAAGVEPETQAPVFAGITLPNADAALTDPSKPEPALVATGEPALSAGSTPSNLPTGKNVSEPGATLPPLSLPTPPLAIRDVAVRTPSPTQDSDEVLPVSEANEAEPEIEAPVFAGITLPNADAALPDPSTPEPVIVAALIPPPATPPAAAPPSDKRSARGERAVAIPAARLEHARSPARVTLTPSPVEDAAQLPPVTAATPSLVTAAPLLAPEAPMPSTPNAAQVLAPPPATLTTPAPERIEAARAPTPQLESTIAQVGDLREALRSARPEMTLRHGEFGFVSLRLEQASPQDWRAVLASRDPGFVPAIQAALAERAVAAASASADSGQFFGQPGAGQNGTSDQRNGASPNGGQGGSQPSPGYFANRDGEAAPDHRRPSTAAALAARAEEGEEVFGGPAGTTQGMFA